MFLQPDGTFWIQLLNFVIFFAILNVVFLRPVSEAIRKRREHINGVKADYETYQTQARKLREQAEGIRAEARRDAEQILSKARNEGSNEAADLSSQYAKRAQDEIESANKTVAGEVDAARVNEPQLVRQLADVMLEKTVSVP